MCLIVFAWRPDHALPLIVAANRDEFYARPTQPLAAWHDAPGVYAGRDLEAGGSWLGVGPGRRFAALTNIRDPEQPHRLRSRGELVAGFLRGHDDVPTALARLAEQSSEFAGFNLLLGDARHLGYLNARQGHGRLLSPGVYGLSNTQLDTPWPKLLKAREALRARLDAPEPEHLLNLLADTQTADDGALPETGVGLATERLLSSVFIASEHYGTRASTVLVCDAAGNRRLLERSFGPHGRHLGDVSLNLKGE